MEENNKIKRFCNKIYLKISNALNDEDQTKKGLFNIFCIAIGFIGFMFLIEIGSIIIGNFIKIESTDKVLTMGIKDVVEILGPFGDFFGGMLNPILTFCSFMALLMTIILQQRELKLSREQVAISVKELGETRKATEISSKALTEQAKSLKIQNFENTFFNMITLHNEIVNNIKIEEHLLDYSSTKTNQKSTKDSSKYEILTNFNSVIKAYPSKNMIIGREAIENICKGIDSFIKDRNLEIITNKSYPHIDNTFYKIHSLNQNREPTLVYDLIHECYSNIIGHYFGNIYQILKFISTSEIIDKRKYSDLFRAQFSAQELKLLFYHCTGSIGSIRFKIYIEEFEFLEHLNIEKDNTFFKYVLYKSIYKNKVFGIKNKKKIEEIKNVITNNITTEIDKIKEEEKYKYLNLYKYFSQEEVENLLQKVKENPKLFIDLVARNLVLLDYSKEDNNKNYKLRE